jgi:hypothetical protein
MAKIILIKPLKLGPTQFQQEIARLKAVGNLPSLESVLQAVSEAREIYASRILAARKSKARG